VPGKLDISLDLRHPNEATLKQMDERLHARFKNFGARYQS